MMTRLQAQMTDKVWSETGCAAGWMEMARVEGSKRLPPHAQQDEMAAGRSSARSLPQSSVVRNRARRTSSSSSSSTRSVYQPCRLADAKPQQ